MDIDFVVTWVNGSDPEWQKKKQNYSKNEGGMNSKRAYREWDAFKYWFRGVEKFAPWVHKVYLITDNQRPEWINEDNPKLEIVDHKDFIPNNCLPVFNSNAIESNVHRINGLSEYFILFNDDTYLTNKVMPEDFFKNGLPCDMLAFNPIIPFMNGTGNFQVNNMEIISKYFSKNDILKNHKLFKLKYGKNLIRTILQMPSKFIVGFFESHLPLAFRKSTFEEVWDKETAILEKTSSSKFRSKENTNVWLFRDWRLAKGEFYPTNVMQLGKFYELSNNNEYIWNDLKSQKYKIMCINDGFNLENVDFINKEFVQVFNSILPQKSSFEK